MRRRRRERAPRSMDATGSGFGFRDVQLGNDFRRKACQHDQDVSDFPPREKAGPLDFVEYDLLAPVEAFQTVPVCVLDQLLAEAVDGAEELRLV